VASKGITKNQISNIKITESRLCRDDFLNFTFCILIFDILMCCVVQAAPPYPPSPVIEKIIWAPVDTIVRRATGRDNLPVTRADDDPL
jgi:hypothetical protein